MLRWNGKTVRFPIRSFVKRKWEQVIREVDLALGKKGGRMVVRWLLLPERHVPFSRAAQLC